MHYAEKKSITLSKNHLEEFSFYLSTVVKQARLHDQHLENEILWFHALNVRDKVLMTMYRTNVRMKGKGRLSFTKGEVYALSMIFGAVKLTPLMQSIKYELTKGL